MGVWDTYRNRIENKGATQRDAALKNEIRMINRKAPNALSYHTVRVFDQFHEFNIRSREMFEGSILQNVTIIDSDNLNEKTICTMPGETIEAGDLIEWKNNYWIVTDKDANVTLYTKAKLLQCNYLLRWVTEDKKIVEQWCMVEDGTKYMPGYYEDRDFIVKRGDSRIAITIPKNEFTCKLGRNNRFLVDDPDAPEPLAFQLTKPMKAGNYYNDHGIYKFVLQEVTGTIDDNRELMIADYFKYFPRENFSNSDGVVPNKREVWL